MLNRKIDLSKTTAGKKSSFFLFIQYAFSYSYTPFDRFVEALLSRRLFELESGERGLLFSVRNRRLGIAIDTG